MLIEQAIPAGAFHLALYLPYVVNTQPLCYDLRALLYLQRLNFVQRLTGGNPHTDEIV